MSYKSRVHIFWQMRIRQGDTTTPWWFPRKTADGNIRADRIVLPIPPGTHWSDAKPLIFPTLTADNPCRAGFNPPRFPSGQHGGLRLALRKKTKAPVPAVPIARPPLRRNQLMFDIPQPGEPLPEATLPATPKAEKVKARWEKPVCDPRLVTTARELPDR